MAVIETQGTTLSIGNAASPEVFTAIGKVVSIDGPNGTTQQIDITNLSSTGREFRNALADFGSVSWEQHYEGSTQHNALYADFVARTSRNFRITLSDSPATIINFTGQIESFPFSFNIDDVVRNSASVKVSGAPTIT